MAAFDLLPPSIYAGDAHENDDNSGRPPRCILDDPLCSPSKSKKACPFQLYLWTCTRRVPVQRAVERDEILYPYKVHDTTLRPLLNITIKSTIYVVRSRSRSCSGGDICGTTPAFRSDVNIATVAIRNSF